MNILIKLTCLIGLVIAPILGQEMPEAETPVIDEAKIQEEVQDQPVLSSSEPDHENTVYYEEAAAE